MAKLLRILLRQTPPKQMRLIWRHRQQLLLSLKSKRMRMLKRKKFKRVALVVLMIYSLMWFDLD